MNENPELFPEWHESEQSNALKELPIGLPDFNKWVGVSLSGGEYFMISVAWIIREVWNDCVVSRIPILSCERFLWERSDSATRAICYEVMGRACERLAYSILPEPIRKDIDNEMGKNHKKESDTYIKEKVSQKFLSKAQVYWQSFDMELKATEIKEQRKSVGSCPILGDRRYLEADKFVFT